MQANDAIKITYHTFLLCKNVPIFVVYWEHIVQCRLFWLNSLRFEIFHCILMTSLTRIFL
ncbi:ORF5 [Helicoverpa armigera SNPV]|nr:ORF5 [Helicoverpa armigera SNPV]